MNVIIWLALSGVVVWLTVFSMGASVWRTLQQNMVDIAGAILGGYLLCSLIAAEVIEPNFVNEHALLTAALGAFGLLTFVKWLTVR